jgi:hypothetical protein
MTEGPSVVIDGKHWQLHHFTGKVMATRKQKEGRVSGFATAPANVVVTSTTVDHHELFLLNEHGIEKSFRFVNFDFPCREGHLISVVWATSPDAQDSPPIAARNHNTDELHLAQAKRIGVTAGKSFGFQAGVIVAAMIVGTFVLGAFATLLLMPFIIVGLLYYFRKQGRMVAERLLASDAFQSLDANLKRLKPPLAQAS